MPDKSTPLLPNAQPIRIQQHSGHFSTGMLDKIEHLIVVLPDKTDAEIWGQCPDGARIRELRSRRKAGDLISSRLRNPANTGVSAGFIKGFDGAGKAPTRFEQLGFAGKLAAAARAENPASVALLVIGLHAEQAIALHEALILALHAHFFQLPAFNQKPADKPRLRTIKLVGTDRRLSLERITAEAEAVNLARWLTALPPNKLDASGYRKCIDSLAKERGWKSEFLDEKKLARLGAGAFLAVAQGNADRDAGIMHLRYRPRGTNKNSAPLISLVGKGIIFDTGGTNLKPFKAMLDMHCDMAGSAVALATLVALHATEYPHPVDCWLAITENRLSNKAYKSRDVVTASNGTTIEVVHTDAEGRMALADTLALAGRKKPKAIIDFATLTGSCVTALTDRYSGAFGNRRNFANTLITAGEVSGERVWPFPMDPDFDDDIKSTAADVLQCAAAGGGDHIQAARFLQRFVPPESNWVHIDLSAATRTGGLAQVPTEITGFGVRYALNLIMDQHDALIADKDS